MAILNNNGLLYKEVKQYILERIENGEFKTGESIPVERNLCKQLEVSRSTTRKAIQELVEQDYLYRVQGKGTFVSESPNSHQDFIGIVLPNCNSNMEMKILNGIQKKIINTKYKMMFLDSKNDSNREAENIKQLKHNGAAGLIRLPALSEKHSITISNLKNEQIPFVLLDRKLKDCDTDSVMSDNKEAGFRAAEHLIKMGHKRIAFITHKFKEASSVNDRIVGYKRGLKEHGLKHNPIK